MFQLIALYRAPAGLVENQDHIFEVVLGKRDDWNEAQQAAQGFLALANASYRPLRVRIRPVQVVRS